MELIIKSAAIGAVSTVLVLLLKKNTPESALLMSLAAAALIITLSAGAVSSITGLLREISENAGIESSVLSVIFKTVVISVVTRISSDICRDGGQLSASSAVELCGAVTAVYVSLPLIKAAVSAVEGLL